jgi:RNA polymerase sigma-70 factor (ECF subfamily)
MVASLVTIEPYPAFTAVRPSPFPLDSLSARLTHRSMLAAKLFLPPLCFHNLMNSFSCSSFVLTTIQIAPGVGVPLVLTPLLPTDPRRVQRKWNLSVSLAQYSVGAEPSGRIDGQVEGSESPRHAGPGKGRCSWIVELSRQKTMTRPDQQSESDLLRLMAAGDEEAFHALYRQFQGPVYRFALHMAGSVAMAEDVTQEVFMALIQKRTRFDAARGPLRCYLIGMARNLLLQRFEREQKLVPFPESEFQGEAHASNGNHRLLPSIPPPDPVRTENIDRVRQAVLSLPADYRETVVLCELQEFSYEEAASALGCPVGTIRSRLHRARTMLAEKLRELQRTERRASVAGGHAAP